MTTTDLVGTVYGLFAGDEPLQIRYVGKTTKNPKSRLKAHLSLVGSVRLQEWIRSVRLRDSEVRMQVLGKYSEKELPEAELMWISFWNQWCDLKNSDSVPHTDKCTNLFRRYCES